MTSELENQKLELEAQKLSLEIAKLARERELFDASADTARVYTFFDDVDTSSVRYCINETAMWSRLNPNCAITVVFNSPGGSVLDGFGLFDHLMWLRSRGHKITTVALGAAASMGGILLQAGDHRIIGKHSWVLIHEISSWNRGKFSELEDDLKFTGRLQSQALDILSSRSKLSKKQIEARWKRRDWWLDASEAIQHSFADEIR